METGPVLSNIAACTDLGMVRENNEDAYIIVDLGDQRTLPDAARISHSLSENYLLMAVSDGVGGEKFGEVASELTVMTLKDTLLRIPKQVSTYDRVVAAVEEANRIVWNEKHFNTSLKGMAATATVALIDQDKVFIAEVGDSRAYLIRGNKIKQVTTDQSFVSMLIQKGILKPEQAVQHPRKNVILQSIGSSEVIKVAVSMFQLRRGDILMLCTDGLWDYLAPEEIKSIVASTPPQIGCQQLVYLAKERGGRDNITVVIAKFEGDGLTTHQASTRLTVAIQALATFDPEEEIEKSHKRTKLLGTEAVNKSYFEKQMAAVTQLQQIYTLEKFPNKSIIEQECKLVLEYLDYCHQLLSVKPDQIQQASQWMANQGMEYVALGEMLTQLQYGLDQINHLKLIVEYLMNTLSPPIPPKP